MYGDEKYVQYILQALLESINLFNTFYIVLLMNLTYTTNKYKLPLFEFVSVTSTEMKYSIAFIFMGQAKEDNVTVTLKMCTVC